MDDKIRLIRQDPAIRKLLGLVRDKYRSLGKVGGSVKFDLFTPEELRAAAGFVGVSPEELKRRSLTLKKLELSLAQTAFGEFSLPELLEQFFGEPIVTREQERSRTLLEEARFIRDLREEFPDGSWLWDRLESKAVDTRWIWTLHKENPSLLAGRLGRVFRAFRELPGEGRTELLPLFAQKTTGNPHGFDGNQIDGRLLTHCLYVRSVADGAEDTGMPRSSEDLNELYAAFGLARDDLWSFVTCRGLIGHTADGVHPLWKAAADTGSVLNVPLKMLGGLTAITPAAGRDVWIVENSGVCSALVDLVPDVPIICTHGQFRTAAWVVLDMLARQDVAFHYSGDFDPEGLQMAQRLLHRYPGHAKLWRMDRDSYRAAISDEDITPRLAKLDGLEDPALADLAAELRQVGKAGYQEGLLELLARDMGK